MSANKVVQTRRKSTRPKHLRREPANDLASHGDEDAFRAFRDGARKVSEVWRAFLRQQAAALALVYANQRYAGASSLWGHAYVDEKQRAKRAVDNAEPAFYDARDALEAALAKHPDLDRLHDLWKWPWLANRRASIRGES